MRLVLGVLLMPLVGGVLAILPVTPQDTPIITLPLAAFFSGLIAGSRGANPIRRGMLTSALGAALLFAGATWIGGPPQSSDGDTMPAAFATVMCVIAAGGIGALGGKIASVGKLDT